MISRVAYVPGLIVALVFGIGACRRVTQPMNRDGMPLSSPSDASAAPVSSSYDASAATAKAPKPPMTVPRGGREPRGWIQLADYQRSGEPLERHLSELTSPYGSEVHLRIKKASIEWLVDHADESYPRLIAALRAQPDAVNVSSVIEVLPLFRRSESIPVLEDVLGHGMYTAARSAGMALGQHDGDRAREALVRALLSPFPETVAGAADGLAERTDKSICEALGALLGHQDAITRWHVIRAAGVRGCLSVEALDSLEASDPNAEVRALAKELREGESGQSDGKQSTP